jgi:hypothetical protein
MVLKYLHQNSETDLPHLTLLAVYICILFYRFSISIIHSMFTKMFNNITMYKALEYFNVCYSLMMVQ